MSVGVFITKEYLKWRLEKLSSNAKKIEAVLWCFLDFKHATVTIAQDKIAKYADTSIRSVLRGIKELEEKKVISRTHKKCKGKKQYIYNQYMILNYKKNKLEVPNHKLTDVEINKIIANFIKKKWKQ